MDKVSKILELTEKFEKLAKDKKWIQKAISKPGRLHKHFKIPEDKEIPMGKLKSEYNKLKGKEDKTKEETSLMKAIGLAIRLKGGDTPGGKKKKGLSKKAQYTGSYPLTQENIRKEVLKAAPELAESSQYISASYGKDSGDSFEVLVKVPFVDQQVRSRIEIQLDTTFNIPRYKDTYPRAEFMVIHPE